MPTAGAPKTVGAVLVVPAALAAVNDARSASIVPNQTGSGGGTFETTVITVDTESVTGFNNTSSKVLYGFKILANVANAVCGLYDTAALETAGTTQGVFIDEGGEATQWDTYDSVWVTPYELQTALTVITNANCTIYHDVR